MKRFSEKNEFFIFKSQKFRPVKFYFQKKLPHASFNLLFELRNRLEIICKIEKTCIVIDCKNQCK